MKPVCWLAVLICPGLLGPQGEEEKIKAKQAEITQFLKTAKEERQLRAAVGDLQQLAEQAYGINRYELSSKLYEQAEKVARALKDVTLVVELQGEIRRAHEIGKEYDRVVKAELRISTEEGKPEDHLAVGKFYAIAKGDWKTALTLLSKGSDGKLKELAAADLAGSSIPEEQIALGDRWCALGEKYRDRGLYWYQEAWPRLTGVPREKLRSKVLGFLFKSPAKPPAEFPTGWKRDNAKLVTLDPVVSHTGRHSVRFDAVPEDSLFTGSSG
jgi:hypothetical protein